MRMSSPGACRFEGHYYGPKRAAGARADEAPVLLAGKLRGVPRVSRDHATLTAKCGMPSHDLIRYWMVCLVNMIYRSNRIA